MAERVAVFVVSEEYDRRCQSIHNNRTVPFMLRNYVRVDCVVARNISTDDDAFRFAKMNGKKKCDSSNELVLIVSKICKHCMPLIAHWFRIN